MARGSKKTVEEAPRRVFARLDADRVVEIVCEVTNIEDEWTPQFLEQCVDVTSESPAPSEDWVRQDGGGFAPPSFTPTPLHLMNAALHDGVEVSLDGKRLGKFAAVGQGWSAIEDDARFMRLYGSLPGGATGVVWRDVSGIDASIPAVSVLAVHRAVFEWRVLWSRFANGRAESAPAAKLSVKSG